MSNSQQNKFVLAVFYVKFNITVDLNDHIGAGAYIHGKNVTFSHQV